MSPPPSWNRCKFSQPGKSRFWGPYALHSTIVPSRKDNCFPFLYESIRKIAYFQREKDEALIESETARNRLDMSEAALNRGMEEKDMAAKELDRLLEKYDR